MRACVHACIRVREWRTYGCTRGRCMCSYACKCACVHVAEDNYKILWRSRRPRVAEKPVGAPVPQFFLEPHDFRGIARFLANVFRNQQSAEMHSIYLSRESWVSFA